MDGCWRDLQERAGMKGDSTPQSEGKQPDYGDLEAAAAVIIWGAVGIAVGLGLGMLWLSL